ncbi:MAG: hypothetical protein R3288_00845 [Woeseiaceae bacterium]|nr:hypothetical protein [Woeseiaceae bacterium]
MRISSNRKNVAVIAAVALPTTLGCMVYLDVAGSGDEQLLVLLRLTARLAFMLFLVVFIARPLRQLVKNPFTRWLLRERRSFGIAFAAVHSVHLGLIAYRFATIPGLNYGIAEAIIGGTAYALMYLMLLTSFDAPARAVGARNWRRLHKTGLYFIGAIFLFTLLPEPDQPLLTWERAWFVTLTAAALVVRLTAWLARSNRPVG